MKIKKEDNVIITAGKDRGKKGKVLKGFPGDARILVEGVNMHKKHVKPRRQGEKGQVVELPAPIDISNVKLLCPSCKKATRVGYQMTDKGKIRQCKKCEATF